MSAGILLIIAVSCLEVRERRIPKPENLIKQEHMVEITAEAHMIEATLRLMTDPGNETPYYSVMFYESLFEKHDINGDDFIENLKYYTSDFYKAQIFYEKVQAYLSTQHDVFQADEVEDEDESS